MRRRHTVPAVLAALVLALPLVACDGGDAEGDLMDETTDAEALGETGARIYLEPDRAETILAEADMDRETFAARVREVSEDPVRAQEYAEAFERVAGEEAPEGVLPPEPEGAPEDTGVSEGAGASGGPDGSDAATD